MNQIMEALNNRDNNIIEAYWMAGVRKTVLMKEVGRQAKGNLIFYASSYGYCIALSRFQENPKRT